MLETDWALLINWIVSGFIGLFFGVVGGYTTYRLERRRDDIKWAREKEQLESNWKHDKEQMELAWQQKLHELEIQFHRDDQVQFRQKLLSGTENPYAAIEQLLNNKGRLSNQRNAEIVKALLEKGLISDQPMTQMSERLLQGIQEFLESGNQPNPPETPSSESQSSENNDGEKK